MSMFAPELLRTHFIAFATCLLVTLLGTALVAYDRRDPISWQVDGSYVFPDHARSGTTVTLTRTYTWLRYCQANVSRTVLGPDNRPRPYQIVLSRLPTFLSKQTSSIDIALPLGLLPMNLTEGAAFIDTVYEFKACGLTSRVWPLVLTLPRVPFTAIR